MNERNDPHKPDNAFQSHFYNMAFCSVSFIRYRLVCIFCSNKQKLGSKTRERIPPNRNRLVMFYNYN
jgi:hypothetical protein